jgi:RHS repeat-associated protein
MSTHRPSASLPTYPQSSNSNESYFDFATLDHDTESNTDHAQFRQYSPTQGRWLSPDPYDGSYDFTNPQSFNRYAYVYNNPLTFTDPTGLYCAVGIKGCKQGVGGAGDGDLSIVDSVNAGSGTYSYDGDTWDATMQDGFGGGVTEGDDGSLWSSAGTGDQFLGYTWQSLLLTGSVQTSTMATGYVSTEGASTDDRSLQLAQALGKTGVYSLNNPCSVPAFYGASAAIAAGGIAAANLGEIVTAAAENYPTLLQTGASMLYKSAGRTPIGPSPFFMAATAFTEVSQLCSGN